jgi:hypothetical protein
VVAVSAVAFVLSVGGGGGRVSRSGQVVRPSMGGPDGTGGAAGALAAPVGGIRLTSSSAASGPIVSQAVHHDVSPPLREMKGVSTPEGIKAPTDVNETLPSRRSSSKPDPVVQRAFGRGQIPATSVNFDGLSAGQAGYSYVPPDPNAAVGSSDVFEISNSEIQIFTKSGGSLYGPVTTNTLWSGFGGGCQSNDDGDGTVVYDQLAGRWIVQQFSVSTTPYMECVAVSTSSDPTGSYYRYAFSYGNVNFNDYPKLAVWPDGYYATFNIFAYGATFSGPQVCAFDRSSIPRTRACCQPTSTE